MEQAPLCPAYKLSFYLLDGNYACKNKNKSVFVILFTHKLCQLFVYGNEQIFLSFLPVNVSLIMKSRKL